MSTQGQVNPECKSPICVFFLLVSLGRQGWFWIHKSHWEDPEIGPRDGDGCQNFCSIETLSCSKWENEFSKWKCTQWGKRLLILCGVNSFSKKPWEQNKHIMLGWCIPEVSSIGNDFRMIIFPFLRQYLRMHDKKLEQGIHVRSLRIFLLHAEPEPEAKSNFYSQKTFLTSSYAPALSSSFFNKKCSHTK